jgi:hypothetical protein
VLMPLCSLDRQRALGRDLIQTQGVLNRERFNPAALLQLSQDAVERTRLDVQSFRLLYSLLQRKGVFRLLRQAGEDDQGRVREPPLSVLLVLHTILPCLLAWSQSLLPNRDHLMQRLELGAERDFARTRDAIRAAAIRGFERFDPASSLQACQGSVERAGFKLCSAELGNIFHHGIAMLGAARQTGQDQQ